VLFFDIIPLAFSVLHNIFLSYLKLTILLSKKYKSITDNQLVESVSDLKIWSNIQIKFKNSIKPKSDFTISQQISPKS